jgi:hypothetical protein
MPARPFVITVFLAAITCGVSAQTGTADGVAALARGDYQRAVEILKPIAEDWRSKDAAAQFFMAGLYESGRGVPVDPLRACALYMRAASRNDNPFGRKADTLFGLAAGRGSEFTQECQRLAIVGFDNGFQPVTFDLGPGHSVEWTLAAATVTYDGRTRREELGLVMPGARFLPLQHTELFTGPTRSIARHFVELFVWQPATQSGTSWKLEWHVFEVVRDQIIGIDTSEPGVIANGDAPPAAETFDVREWAALRVDDNGNAQWAVLKGPHARSDGIETDAERSEVRETAAARDAALKTVEWSKRSDVHRQPAMTYADSEGCGYFQLVGWTADRDEVVVVRADAQALGISTGAATFDLARSSSNISIEAYVYDAPQRHLNFCTDVIIREQESVEPEVWRAIAGTVSVEMSMPGTRSGPRATVTLTDVVVRNSAGTTVRLSRPVRLSAIVGAVFG